ncbi:hypothetical protein SLEP1_g26288 [Rubroshorea leprosula]|uniref:Retrotransposon gag domain-containing protein n=1 Tax=Rubroshorea leprosula TaxID=152421 RepID=A0AAV5JS05_9ROSI|nr:hypothetical protein SLEP1_g26288 [Rubroshorea leprosula]
MPLRGQVKKPLGQGQLLNKPPPQPLPQIPNTFPPVDHVKGGDENQPHNSASTANQLLAWNNPGDPLINLLNPAPQSLAPQQDPQLVQHAPALSESQGQSHIALAQQPLPDDVTRCLDSLEKLVAEQRGAPPPHHNTDSIPHPLNTNITLESYPAEMASSFAIKFSNRRLIRKTTSELMRVKQRDGESLKNYMSKFNDATLEVSSFDKAVGIATVISSLDHERFRDSLIKYPATTINEIKNKMDLRRPGPMRSSAATRDHTRYCNFHQDHGPTKEQCNSLRKQTRRGISASPTSASTTSQNYTYDYGRLGSMGTEL